ncbi:hypothetical protein K2173_016900 [Erythroxylum novogranatense]|uniref:C2H2-type domain-containing protein n=1 Tax=Erythroxylum novogranatense TaxID=1862640 RepID=A0AAV8U8E7_9ROSI|nr:hypothetical protein K2173_016900 [Erythroxylum novogranatense]
MAAELGVLSLTQLQKLAQSQQNQCHHHHQSNPGMTSDAWMWKPVQAQEDDKSWEVRAFAEDTSNVMGSTWPPRSYTCTFCRREFRSAQALGGHMNVHRRDRARLHQSQPSSADPNSSSTSSSLFVIQTQDFSTSGGLSLLYQLPNNHGGVLSSTNMNAAGFVGQSLNLSVATPTQTVANSYCFNNSNKAETSSSVDNSNNITSINNCKDLGNPEELDLELRLGQSGPRATSSS